jgi:hypothetical protein
MPDHNSSIQYDYKKLTLCLITLLFHFTTFKQDKNNW